MAKLIGELKIDTTEAMEKIRRLNIEAESLQKAMDSVKLAAEQSAEAMREFVETCSNIKVDL